MSEHISQSLDSDEDDPVLRELKRQVSSDQQIVIITSEDGRNQYFIVNKDKDWNSLLSDTGLLTVSDPDQAIALLNELGGLKEDRNSLLNDPSESTNFSTDCIPVNAQVVSSGCGAIFNNPSINNKDDTLSRKRRRPHFEHNTLDTHTSMVSQQAKQEPQFTNTNNNSQEYFYLPDSNHNDHLSIVESDAYRYLTDMNDSRYSSANVLVTHNSHLMKNDSLANSARMNHGDEQFLVDDHRLMNNMFDNGLDGIDLECVFNDLKSKDTLESDDTSIVMVDEIPPMPPKFVPVFDNQPDSFQNVYLQFLVDSIDKTRLNYQSTVNEIGNNEC